MRRCPFLYAFSLLAFCLGPTSAQAATQSQRDPRAVALASRSLAALTGKITLTDLTLQGSVAYRAGSDQQTGSVLVLARGNVASNLTLNLSGGPRNEMRNGPAGVWSGIDGVRYAMALHNCWPDADWFYPALSFQALSTDPGLGLAYVGPETKNGLSVVHIRLFRVVPNQAPSVTTTIETLSTEDLYVDASSYVPLFLDFNLHPDADLSRNIPVEIAFSDYQRMGGIVVPAHVQKFFNGTLLLDLTLTSAAINSGLPASDFALTTQSGPLEPAPRVKRSTPSTATPPQQSPGRGPEATGGAR
jgi:hypothetical protein